MNGADVLIESLLDCGVDTCFANPGTSEMHMVDAISKTESFHAYLCLFEGVCTGAADGYGRMRRSPATTLLHLGAGLGNGIANLHNCRRAATPLVNIVGDHAKDHVVYDAPLTSDIEAVAKPVSSWIRTSNAPNELWDDVQEAVGAAKSGHMDSQGNISTLIVPSDCAWGPAELGTQLISASAPAGADADLISSVAGKIDAKTMLLVDGDGLLEEGVRAAGKIAKKTGCRIFSPTFPARVECGPELPSVDRLPYFPEQILALLQSVEKLVLVGASAPVSFFAYQNVPSLLVPEDCEVIEVVKRHQNVTEALTSLADELGASSYETPTAGRPDLPVGPISVRHIATILAAKVPDHSIVTVDSGGGGAAYPVMQKCVSFSWLNLTGGSIGDAGPTAVGAAIACPDRPVFALAGDGGAMYTNQYLWTAARENLNVTSVIFSNRQYNILEVEFQRLGVNEINEKAARLFDLSGPSIDWVKLSEAHGVPASKVETCEEFAAAMDQANSLAGPMLIEAMV